MKKELFHEGWNYVEGGGCVLETLFAGTPKQHPVVLPHDAFIELPRTDNPRNCGNGYFEPVNCHYIKELQA